MTFIPPACHNICMDMPDIGTVLGMTNIPLPVDDLKRLHDAGCTTALEFVPWHVIEPARGAYDWRIIDTAVERLRGAGMRALLLGPNSVPNCLPDGWYVHTLQGRPIKEIDPANKVTVWPALSPWNDEAQSYQNDFITRLCKRYNADDVLCLQSHSRDGEALLPPGIAALYDPCAVASFREWVGDATAKPDPSHYATQGWLYSTLKDVLVAQQRIYCESHPAREVWLQLHPYYAPWPCSGNARILDYYRAVIAEVKPAKLNALLFTVFQNGHDAFIFKFIADLQALGIDVWTGSEWVEGLTRNTPAAVRLGLRGLLTAPIHPYTGRKAMEPWMFEVFADSSRQFRGGTGA